MPVYRARNSSKHGVVDGGERRRGARRGCRARTDVTPIFRRPAELLSLKRGARGRGRGRKGKKRVHVEKFPDADQAVSRIETNGRLISALLGLFAQPKPRPIFCAAHPPCSAPGAISNGTISLHDRAVSPSLIGSSTLSSYIAALRSMLCHWLSPCITPCNSILLLRLLVALPFLGTALLLGPLPLPDTSLQTGHLSGITTAWIRPSFYPVVKPDRLFRPLAKTIFAAFCPIGGGVEQVHGLSPRSLELSRVRAERARVISHLMDHC